MLYPILTWLTCIVLLISSGIHAEDDTHIVVAWLENNNVMIWRSGDAAPTQHTAPDPVTGNIRQLLLSSDGKYLAVNVAYPGSLWLATPNDTILIEAVPNQSLPADDPKVIRIGNLQRGANDSFYFNTFDQLSHYTFQHDDLYSLDAASLTIKLLIPPSQAGLFNLSPDSQHIALVQSGAYGKADGKISLVDNSGQNRLDVLDFPAVSTASDYDFYPPLFWEADSSAFNLAIPDKDLVYHDDTALTTLWHIAADGTKTQRGTVQASFFGQPQWSDDGKQMIYLQRKGDVSANQFALMVAAGDGSNAAVYATDAAGAIGLPQWLPNSDQFIYSQGEPGDYWLGQSGQPPQALPGKIFNPLFVDSTTYVFTNAVNELRYAHLGDTASTLIAKITDGLTVFDAIKLP